MNDNFDDYDFTPSSSSNLASLFDTSSINSEDSSLIYTAPKQPKPVGHSELKTESSKAESCVICARVVQVWKLADNKYFGIGKHGLAIIGSSVQNTYEIILYREKRNVIVRIKIGPNFEIFLKKDAFASFYDSLKENWLIKFNSSDDCTIMVNHIEKFGGKIVTASVKTKSVHQTTIKQDIKSDEDNNSNNLENKAKADILSRIAKMGQSILPNKTSEADDSDECMKYKENETQSLSEDKTNEAQHVIPSLSTTNIVPLPSQHFQVPNTFVIGQPMSYDPLSLYVAESHVQNSEMRMSLSQISEKVNQILKLVENEKPTNDNSDGLKSKLKVLDLRNENLLKELKFYKEENIKLKQQISQLEYSVKTEELNKLELNRSKEQEAFKIVNLETQITTYKEDIKNLSDTIEKQKNEMEDLKMQIDKSETNSRLETEISDMNRTIADLTSKLQDYEERENVLELKNTENDEKITNFITKLKSSMNALYGNIIASLDDDKKYSTSEVNSIIAQNIKSTTLNVIQNFQQVYKNDAETN